MQLSQISTILEKCYIFKKTSVAGRGLHKLLLWPRKTKNMVVHHGTIGQPHGTSGHHGATPKVGKPGTQRHPFQARLSPWISHTACPHWSGHPCQDGCFWCWSTAGWAISMPWVLLPGVHTNWPSKVHSFSSHLARPEESQNITQAKCHWHSSSQKTRTLVGYSLAVPLLKRCLWSQTSLFRDLLGSLEVYIE